MSQELVCLIENRENCSKMKSQETRSLGLVISFDWLLKYDKGESFDTRMANHVLTEYSPVFTAARHTLR